MKAIDINSNWELIRRLQPHVASHADEPVTFHAAVREAIATHLPELLPHTSEIETMAAAYFGVEA